MAGRALAAGGLAAEVTLRRAEPRDAAVCGRIFYEAFRAINLKHGFRQDLPSPEAGAGALAGIFAHPGYYSLVAEAGPAIAGSACLDERSAVASIGPVMVDPERQNGGVGRKLMEGLMARAAERHFPGVRLVQAAFHCRSLSLYASMGFVVREPLAVMQGPPPARLVDGGGVRPAREKDLEGCNRLCREVHGHDRAGELRDAVVRGTAAVVERRRRIVGYTTETGFFGHAVGETNEDVEALISAAAGFGGPGFLVPVRNAKLFRWCLEQRLRVVEPMTLMSVGLYNEPSGAWLPSIGY